MKTTITVLSLALALCVFSAAKPNKQKEKGKSGQRAEHLITVADDFIVDIYHNGAQVPDSKRKMVLERFGATVERITADVRKGDWLVFNVVNNRLRWGGAYYFAVAGVLAPNEFGFVSELESGRWSVCDDPEQSRDFIRKRDFMSYNRAVKVERPWHEGTKFMKQYAGKAWHGEPLWGRARNTWIKVIVK